MLEGLKGGDRVIVVRPTHDPDEPRYVDRIYENAGVAPPAALLDWDEQTEVWCADYRTRSPGSNIVEVLSDRCVYAFDLLVERLVVAYGISSRPQVPRDRSRIRGFPDVNVGVRAILGERAFPADRGHYLAHASGGGLDINLFPHRRDLNRGWKDDGKRFRQMERYVAEHPGIFFYQRPIYDDDSWIPSELEYGVLVNDTHWWVGVFKNKPTDF